MAQTKIYPATKQQAENIQDTVDEINAKIVTSTYQAKIVTPTTSQQLIEPDSGYTALSSVTVNPANTTDLENWISRNDQADPIYLTLTTPAIPSYACYQQTRLVTFEDANATSIGDYAFAYCASLQEINIRNATSIGIRAFYTCSSLREVYAPENRTLQSGGFMECQELTKVDLRNTNIFPDYTFYNCVNLMYLDCRNLNAVNGSVMSNNTALKIVDLTSCDTPPSIRSEGFSTLSLDWKAVVKNDTVKALFQSATNWSAYADRIYTVAEIEALYGDTYDNLYLQWFGHPRFDESEGE